MKPASETVAGKMSAEVVLANSPNSVWNHRLQDNSFILSYKKTRSWTGGIVTENELFCPSTRGMADSELIAQCSDDSWDGRKDFPARSQLRGGPSFHALRFTVSGSETRAKPEGFYAVLCYSPRVMAQDQPVKALVIALTDHAAAAVYSINRLQPDSLCFVMPEGAKSLVESEIQPKIEHMPRRWDWVILAETGELVGCYQTLSRTLPEMLRTWDVQPGELVVDVTDATPAMAGALTLVTMPTSSRIVSLVPAQEGQEGDRIDIAGQPFVWTQENPWDEAASFSRREGCELFNRRLFAAAAKIFREIEARVSGGQKPLYRAFGDLADGYDLWERFHYRQAWEKLKGAVKAFEMAALWGGPPGLKIGRAHV